MFVCPKCHFELTESSEELHCANCDRVWPIRDGVPLFVDGDYYWQHLERNKFPDLLKAARAGEWHEALEEQVSSWELDYACAKNRADFRFLLHLSENSTVLDAGCGWGAVSCALAQICDKVFALDRTIENAFFVKVRTEQTGFRNIVPVGASVTELPFPDEMFDTIILNGVLEWIAVPGRHKAVAGHQTNALNQAYRCLKQGGELFVGIENRFGIQYCLGYRDEHTGLRFVTVLPRFLANCLSSFSSNCDYTAFTHSPAGLRKLLLKIGFSQIREYLLFPDYRSIRYMVELSDSHSVRDVLKSASGNSKRRWLKTSLLTSGIGTFLGLQNRFVPAFGIVAIK